MKCILSETEPILYKGGRIAPLYKGKGSAHEASSYRGILLAPVFGKILHAWSRHRVLPTLDSRMSQGQMGGRSGQQTATAAHCIRLHIQLAKAVNASTAIVFVDIKAAFHSMVRQFIFQGRSHPDTAFLHSSLSADDFDIEAIQAELLHRARNPPSDIPEGLRFWLAEMRQETWFWAPPVHGDFAQSQLTLTKQGTRPGSPMADAGFNLLAAEVARCINLRLSQSRLYNEGMAALAARTPAIMWVDDLALPLASTSAAMLPSVIGEAVGILHDVFSRFALSLNFSKGKTEVLASFRGRGAEQMRKQYFTNPQMPVLVASTESHILSVRLTSTYKHLGTVVGMEADLHHEINHRIGSARQAFHELAKPVFLSKQLPVTVRLSLMHSLVLSRMLYGAAVWTDVTPTMLKKLEHAVISFQRRILGETFWQSERVDDTTFRAKHQLPSFRLLWAKFRLAYLEHVVHTAPEFYRSLLIAEFQLGHGWLCEVKGDLQWLAKYSTLTCHGFHLMKPIGTGSPFGTTFAVLDTGERTFFLPFANIFSNFMLPLKQVRFLPILRPIFKDWVIVGKPLKKFKMPHPVFGPLSLLAINVNAVFQQNSCSLFIGFNNIKSSKMKEHSFRVALVDRVFVTFGQPGASNNICISGRIVASRGFCVPKLRMNRLRSS